MKIDVSDGVNAFGPVGCAAVKLIDDGGAPYTGVNTAAWSFRTTRRSGGRPRQPRDCRVNLEARRLAPSTERNTATTVHPQHGHTDVAVFRVCGGASCPESPSNGAGYRTARKSSASAAGRSATVADAQACPPHLDADGLCPGCRTVTARTARTFPPRSFFRLQWSVESMQGSRASVRRRKGYAP